MGWDVWRDEHPSGWTETYGASQTEFIIVDVDESDEAQYSINWSTDFHSFDFTRRWLFSDHFQRYRLVVQRPEGGLETFDSRATRGYEIAERIEPEGAVLIRILLGDSSLAWQLFPIEQAPDHRILGVASNVYDRDAIEAVIRETGTPSVVGIQHEIFNEFELRLSRRIKHSEIHSLRRANYA
jgi:hypothetical protein